MKKVKLCSNCHFETVVRNGFCDECGTEIYEERKYVVTEDWDEEEDEWDSGIYIKYGIPGTKSRSSLEAIRRQEV